MGPPRTRDPAGVVECDLRGSALRIAQRRKTRWRWGGVGSNRTPWAAYAKRVYIRRGGGVEVMARGVGQAKRI